MKKIALLFILNFGIALPNSDVINISVFSKRGAMGAVAGIALTKLATKALNDYSYSLLTPEQQKKYDKEIASGIQQKEYLSFLELMVVVAFPITCFRLLINK